MERAHSSIDADDDYVIEGWFESQREYKPMHRGMWTFE